MQWLVIGIIIVVIVIIIIIKMRKQKEDDDLEGVLGGIKRKMIECCKRDKFKGF